MTQLIALPDGRRIAVDDQGTPVGWSAGGRVAAFVPIRPAPFPCSRTGSPPSWTPPTRLSRRCGDADAVAGPEHGRWWEQSIADSRLHVVPGAGHLVALTAWRDVLAAVTA